MGTILIFCAHSDDEAVGMAGTILKYVEEGKEIIKVVFSFGESSHPHFKEEVVIDRRLSESEEASKFIGIKETIFLGLPDTKVKQNVESSDLQRQIKDLLGKYRPEKIFIPTASDPHPDHRAVNYIVLSIIDKMRKTYPVYEFEVWNIVNESKPMVFIDITPYYRKKVLYMKMFRSQWQYMYALWLPVYFRSRAYGRRNGCKYAERFYKVR
ncbi:MAG: PIG-L deacetylase family protein [Candidatus Woesearchaeota archaeon]